MQIYSFLYLISTCICLFFCTGMTYAQVGQLDTNFGTDGIAKTIISPADDQSLTICVLPDDRFLVAGYSTIETDNRGFSMVMYNPNGEIDIAFADNGIMTEDLSAGNDVITSAVILDDGSILVSGYATLDDYYVVVAKYTPQGVADETFAANGKFDMDFGYGNDQGRSIAVQPDGKIILGGIAEDADSVTNFLVLRLNASGQTDNSFGQDGIVMSVEGTEGCYLKNIKLQDDGKILAIGVCNKIDTGNGDYGDVMLARYNSDGTPDLNFGSNGVIITSFGESTDIMYSILLQQDNKIIICGLVASNTDAGDLAMMRFHANGSLDTSFGDEGMVITDLDNSLDYCEPSLIQPNGKIILGGFIYTYSDESYDLLISRFNSDGSPDSTFGTNGWTRTGIAINTREYGFAMAFQSNYDILLAGSSKELSAGNYDFITARYIGDHSLGTGKDNIVQNKLIHIYPNPSSNKITIEYHLDFPDHITVNLFNILGENIKLLINEEKSESGHHKRTIDVGALKSGVYLLKLEGEKTFGTRMLIKN